MTHTADAKDAKAEPPGVDAGGKRGNDAPGARGRETGSDAAVDTARHVDTGSDAAVDTGRRVDTGSDAAVDTGRHHEASSDGGSSASDADWCSQQQATRFFCNDFDRGTAVTSGWSGLNRDPDAGTSFTRETTHIVSPPYGAAGVNGAFSGESDSTSQLYAYLSSGPTATPTALTCELEVYPVAFSTVSDDVTAFFQLYFNTVSEGVVTEASEVDLRSDTAGNVLVAQYVPTPESNVANPTTVAMLPGHWVHVTLALSSNSSSAAYTVTIGGTTKSGTLLAFPATTQIGVSVGPDDYSGGSSGWSFDYDNVICY
jgi:hypothetical protein